MNTKNIGDFGETAVCEEITKKGYKILTRNYRIKSGEIDIIAKDDDTFVFIEVKTRKNDIYGNASEYVTLTKQKKIILTAKHYLGKNIDVPIRFDVAEVYYKQQEPQNKIYEINYIENAFSE